MYLYSLRYCLLGLPYSQTETRIYSSEEITERGSEKWGTETETQSKTILSIRFVVYDK